MNSETSTPVREFTEQLAATRRGARLARHLAVRQLDLWGVPCDSELSQCVAMVVGELGANAVTHGKVPGRDFGLRLAFGPHTIRIEVTDARTERRPPLLGSGAPLPSDAETGRGLLLVQALSRAWGVTPRVVGKTVWAEVAVAATIGVPSAVPRGSGRT
jgi:anti-sigma regulatory factor (Ser/Thr protein kinase)